MTIETGWLLVIALIIMGTIMMLVRTMIVTMFFIMVAVKIMIMTTSNSIGMFCN